MPANRRKLDQIFDPAFISSPEELSVNEVRRRRDECRHEEAVLSFVRRWLHGKLDILGAERDRRRTSSTELSGRLKEILAPGTTRNSRGARATLPSADVQNAGRRFVERLVSSAHLARLSEMPDSEIEELVERLVSEESKISDQRRRLFEVLDVLESDLVARYKSGKTSADELIGP